MPWRNFLLVLHIGGAIALFGPTFTFPFFGVVGEKHNGEPRTLLKLNWLVAKHLVVPADYILPISGALLILQSKGAWNPFNKEGAWLGLAIVLFVIMYLIATFIQMPALKKALTLAEAGQFSDPAFGASMQKMKKFGPVLGILLVAVMVLMIVKPGSGFIHP